MDPIKVLWLGFAVPDEVARQLFEADPSPAIQTHKFGWSFARALREAFSEVILVSACPVQNFPIVRRIVFTQTSFYSHGMRGVTLGFLNFIVLKHLSRLFACFISAFPLLKKQKIDWIFVHGVHTPYLFFSLAAGLFGYKVAVVLTDPPGVILATDGKATRWMKLVDAWLVKKLLCRVDAVCALAPDLSHQLAPKCPSLIFPGILDSTLDTYSVPVLYRELKSIRKPFTIIYAGGLSRSYGVDRLVNAVVNLASELEVVLILFGKGDQEKNIRLLASNNPRVIYGGFVDTATLNPELSRADLLINPRPTDSFVSAQSFPSKLIEYLSTGRPVLTTRIPSIPYELRPFFYYIEEESHIGIMKSIVAVMNLTSDNRLARAFAARTFVRSNYSEKATGFRIKTFINELAMHKIRNS